MPIPYDRNKTKKTWFNPTLSAEFYLAVVMAEIWARRKPNCHSARENGQRRIWCLPFRVAINYTEWGDWSSQKDYVLNELETVQEEAKKQ